MKIYKLEEMNYEEKECTKCKETYPATEEYFYKQLTRTKTKGAFYRLSSWCKKCSIKSSAKWQESISVERKREYYKKCDSSDRRKKVKRDFGKYQREIGYTKEWQENNREWLYNYNKTRAMHKSHDISETEWFECLDYFDSKCAYCGITEGEAYELYDQLLHKEHVEHNGANDITNCVPACKGCNSQKWEFEMNEWYNKDNPVYDIKRYNRIVQWLLSFAK
ncbi:HNH endonuclease signature motif containing protein [Lederbergia citrisecunda]|uniref:HNH endonuclease signature motif containing protein n=1 Tax=Lederbergia citrisecunda TaxID=2833583 RepID=UPI003D27B8BB